MPPRKRLGQLLTELGVVDEHQLQSALGHQKQWGGKLGGVLVQKGFCKESEVVAALSKHLGMPSVKLADATVDPRAVKFVSKQIAEKLHVFPYEISGSGRSEVVTIAMSDPTDLSAVDQLAFHTGKRIKPMLAGDSEIVQAIHQHYADEKKAAAAPAAPLAGARPAAPPVPAPSPQGTEFPRRVAPPATMAPSAGAQRLTPAGAMPYIPPPIPVMAPKPAQKLEEIEPDESMATAPPKPEPLDLPPDDGQMMGLEPIAAHSQFGDEVAGQEEVAGEGGAADVIEGLESAGVPHEGAEEAAQMEGLEPAAAHAQDPAPDGGWGAATLAEGWQAEAQAPAGADGWSADPPSPDAPANDFGAAQGWSAPQEQAEGWGGAEQPEVPAGAAWGSEQGWGGEQPAGSATAGSAIAETPGEELPMDAIIGTAEAVEGEPETPAWSDEPPAAEQVQEHAAAEEAPAWGEAATGDPAQEQAAQEASLVASEHQEAPPEHPAHEEAAHEEGEAAADHHPSADAPDAWASSEDPLAAEADPPAWSEASLPERALANAPTEPGADNAEPGRVVAPPTDKFALANAAGKTVEEPAAAETEAPPEWGDALAEETRTAASGEEYAAASAESAAAGEESAAATEESAAPSEESAASREEFAASTEEFAAPSEGFAAPSEGFAAPSEGFAAPSEGFAAQIEESAAPSGGFAAQIEESAAPSEEFAAPGEEFAAPNEEFAAPNEEFDAPNEEFAAPSEESGPPIEESAQPRGEFAASAEESAPPSDEQADRKLEGWVAPTAEPEPQGSGWFGEALETTPPLSAADLGTLASVGVDPNDGVGALRLLATLVRVLHRHQQLDPDAVANEIRESRKQAAAERAVAEGEVAEGEVGGVAESRELGSSGEQAPPSGPAET